MMEAELLKEKINYCASEKIPFLFAVDFELSEGIFIDNPQKQNEILYHTPLGSNSTVHLDLDKDKNISLISYPETFEKYQEKFDIVMNALKRGDSFLTNLTVKTLIETELSLKEIFLLSKAPYCLYVPGRFVCFSPERFVRISSGIISTNPMKGTINADIPGAENIILSDEKETAEHNTIVDLLRNDLGMVANDINVDRFRYIDHIITKQRNILQVSSEISGKLNKNYCSKLGDLLFQLLPAGSISGAPKRSTIDIIRKAESGLRGFYTGVFGFFDGEDFDSAVLIRYIEEENDKKYFRSGGGITVNSNSENEYKEVLEKIYFPFV